MNSLDPIASAAISDAVPPPSEEGALRPGAVSAVVLLTLCGFLSMFARVQLSGLLPLIKLEFRLSDVQLGLLTGTAFSIMYSTAALPLAWVSDRVNRSRFLTGALVLWSGMTAVSGLAVLYWHMLLARIGLALGEAVLTPTAHSIIADYYPPRRRSLPIGIETAGTSLGVMAGLSVAGWAGAMFGWRVALMIAAAPGVVLAIAMFLWLEEPPRSRVRSATPTGNTIEVIRALWRIPPYRWLVFAGTLNASMTSGMSQWIPSFFARTHELPLTVLGPSVGLALGLSLTFGAILGGWMSDRAAALDPAAPFRNCALMSIAIVPLLLGAFWASNPVAALVCVGLWNLLAGMFVPIVFCGIQNACDPRFRATAVASAVLVTVLVAYGLIPTIIGFISDHLQPTLGRQSLRAALTAMVFLPVLAIAAYTRLSRCRFPER